MGDSDVAALHSNLKTAVAGLKMPLLHKIALAFEFLSAHPDGARAARRKGSKSCAPLSTCTILTTLDYRWEDKAAAAASHA
jgi:hypothetical protein